MEKLYKDRSWMVEHYTNRGESSPAVAREAGCSKPTILRWLRKLKIPTRDCNEGIFLAIRNFLTFSPTLLEILGGELLGDGCVLMMSNRSARYQHSSKYEGYLVWLSAQFADLGLEQSGRITMRQDRRTGAISYNYNTKSYPELIAIRHRWYPDGKKVVPKDLKLTPLICRHWYIGDGCLVHPKLGRPYIKLATCGFNKQSVEYLVKELGGRGFKITRQPASNEIYLSPYSVQDFLRWIGPCPISCYDYKWDY